MGESTEQRATDSVR